MNASRPYSDVLRAAFAAALLLASTAASAVVHDGGPGIAVDRGVAPQRRGALTLHAVRLDRRTFQANALPGRGIDLPSTGNAPQHARFSRADQQGADYTWVGKVDTEFGEQSVVVTFGPDATFGTIPQRHGPPLRVQAHHGRAWLVEGESRSLLRAGSPSDARIAPMAKALAREGIAVVPGPGILAAAPTVEMIIAYTPSMVTRYNTSTGVDTRLNFLEQVANQAFYDTPANVRIHVAAHLLLNNTSTIDNGAMLELITNPSTGVTKTQIDNWRNQYKADLVAVVRSFDLDTQPDCGQGWIGGYHGSAFSASTGFAVISDGQDGNAFCPDLTFAHEVGHNLGSHHDTETAGGDFGAWEWSRGYRQTLSPSSGFATVMAYQDGPQVLLGRFSNPRLPFCQARYCGLEGQADNARTLSDSGWQVAGYRGAIINPPATLSLSLVGASTAEGDSGSHALTFRATLSGTSSSPVYFTATTGGGTATAGSDYVALNPDTFYSVDPGKTFRDFTVTVLGDTAIEPDETFQVTLAKVSGAVATVGVTGTIANDDVPQLSIADATINEGDSGNKSMTFVVSLSTPSPGPVSYTVQTLTTSTTTAQAGVDFVASSATQTIPAGATSQSFAVPVIGDTAVEGNEVFLVTVDGVTGATVADGAARATIVNDDKPTIAIADASITEGNSGTKSMVFTLALSQPTTTPVTFNYSTLLSPGTTASAGDFTPVNNAFAQIPIGQSGKTISITIAGDTAPEVHETFLVALANVAGAVVADGYGRGTILNDDTPVMTIANVTMAEGSSGFPVMAFTVQLSGPAAVPVTFDIATLATPTTTATAGSDYVAKTQAGRVIGVGATSAPFNVAIVGDTAVEANEVFLVTISNVAGATLGYGTARATITNDD